METGDDLFDFGSHFGGLKRGGEGRWKVEEMSLGEVDRCLWWLKLADSLDAGHLSLSPLE